MKSCTLFLSFLLGISSQEEAVEWETPVSVDLPPGADLSGKWRLIRVDTGREVPVQMVAGTSPVARWIDKGPRGEKREYRLESQGPNPFPLVECTQNERADLKVRWSGKDVLRYNAGLVGPPANVDPAYERSGYIHPVWTPNGRQISNDFPRKAEHHHGLWFAWRTAEFEGRSVNAWAPLEKLGRVEFAKVEETCSGPVFGGFRTRQRFLDQGAPGGPKEVLGETWDLKAYATRDVFVFDLEVVQTCASDSPLIVKKSYYGGLGFRGSAQWEGKEAVEFLTSEGKTRVDGNGTPARWVAMNGKIDGREAGIAFLCHPSNFRAPQPTRLHPYEPFFCWVPGHDEEFRIEPGKPFVSRYRFIVADRSLGAAEMNWFWAAYAEPPPVRLTLGIR